MLNPNLKDKIVRVFFLIIRDVFYCLFIALMILGIIEVFKPGFFLNYLDLTWYLAILILLGAVYILFSPPKVKEAKKMKLLDYSTVILLSIIFGFFVFYFLRNIGPLNILIGVCTTFISYLFIILSFKENI